MIKGLAVDARERVTLKTVLPLVALGSGLAAAPAGALELGELTVDSKLGQPLRASIAYALAPNEMLSDTCVSISAAPATAGLPGIGPNTVSITERAIVITGKTAIREPMLGARVLVNCPYTPNLSREYMLFVDPAGVVEQRAAAAAAATAPVARLQDETRTVSASRTATQPALLDIPGGQASRYQVQPGDTLSGIAGRIENRSMSLWPAVNAIFAANPDAFIDNDPNRLKAGSWLTIPSLDGMAPVVAAAAPSETPVSPAQPVEVNSAADVTDTLALVEAAATYEPAAFDQPLETATDAAAVTDTTADLMPGDVTLEDLSAAPVETVDIPDTTLEGPQTTASSPNVPTAIISTGARSESTSTLVWLAGLGLAAIAALLLFGRRFRDRFDSTPAAKGVSHASPGTAAANDFTNCDIADDSPTEENLVLDADLEIGTGLDEGVDVDVSQDFGFAATTELDIELPFEPIAKAPSGDTDIIPPLSRQMESILESEVLPEDDDYDMSIIVDATKMPQPEDVTERDLQAVEVDAPELEETDNDFTISQDAEYDLLEQDYEDELTATQALNLEIERAAAGLVKDLNDTSAGDDTAALEIAEASVMDDATSQLPAFDGDTTAEFDSAYDPDDTSAVTVNMTHEDPTAEMRVANDDETVEMDIEGGRVDTRRS